VNIDPLLQLMDRLMLRSGKRGFETSSAYWLLRYARGADSGAGSYNHFAEFKADVLNTLVVDHSITSVIEFGCGDGNQLGLAKYPDYLGIDISPVAVRICKRRFASDDSKRFLLLKHYRGQRAELALSLDVIYHLVEDTVFEQYMQQLFNAATRYVAIYSSDTDDNSTHGAPHVRHRKFSEWVERHAPHWQPMEQVPNPYPFNGDSARTSFSDFSIYAPKL
jgi:SAM-dependent methyltransferase